jgi:hypothetical protein
MKTWELKLQRWDSFIEELHEAEFASDDNGEGGEVETNKDNSTTLQLPGLENASRDGES